MSDKSASEELAALAGDGAEGAEAAEWEQAAEGGGRRRPLAVAYVTETWPPEVNGVATTAAQFVAGLQRRGHGVQLLRPRQRPDMPAALRAGVQAGVQADVPCGLHEVLVRSWPIPRYPELRMGLPCRRLLRGVWARRRPDVVHVATEGPLGWSALLAASDLGLPVSSDFRTNFQAYSQHYGIGWLQGPILGLLRRFHNRCHCTLVPTEALRQALHQQGFERLHVVPRGVDSSRFGPTQRSASLRAAWGAGPDDLVLGCVGRLAPEKNLALLLATWQALRALQPRARLVLVGDGPLRAELQRRCPDVVLAGVQQGQALAAHFASFDLFGFPSLTETFGNVVLEALASGLPVVAFDRAAAGQLIRPGHNGLLAPPGDADGFTAATLALAADPARRAVMARQACATAAAQGWDAVVAGFEGHLARVAALGAAAPTTQLGAAAPIRQLGAAAPVAELGAAAPVASAPSPALAAGFSRAGAPAGPDPAGRLPSAPRCPARAPERCSR